ncbi:MAG: GxxExxY protein [Kofleriaceae bacterium]
MLIEPSNEVDVLAHQLIGAAIEVHRALGPGFVESVYQQALAIELSHRDIPFSQQPVEQIYYRHQLVGEHRLDLVVGGKLLVELKAVETINNQHLAQMLSYLRATGFELGLILNFHAAVLREGIRRVVPRTHVRDGIQ